MSLTVESNIVHVAAPIKNLQWDLASILMSARHFHHSQNTFDNLAAYESGYRCSRVWPDHIASQTPVPESALDVIDEISNKA
jgi:hypothetical protein